MRKLNFSLKTTNSTRDHPLTSVGRSVNEWNEPGLALVIGVFVISYRLDKLAMFLWTKAMLYEARIS